MLTCDGIAEQGLVMPATTHMLQHIFEYDMALVYYSKLLMQCYDELKKELQRLNDMPDKPLSIVIMCLYQNKGIFLQRRKKQFEEITEEEFASMVKIYKEIYNG